MNTVMSPVEAEDVLGQAARLARGRGKRWHWPR